MGSVQFQIAPPSSLYFSISTGPFRCSQCYLQGFQSVARVPIRSMCPFVYLASVCPSLQCLISTLTQAGGGGLLFRLLVPSRCVEEPALLSRLRCSGSRLFYMERALCCARFQPSGVPQKHGTKSCACFLCLPSLSGSGSQELDGRTLPGCGAPSPLLDPSLKFPRCQSGVYTFCPPLTQPQSPPAPVGFLRPVSHLTVTLPADVDHPESQEVFD